MRAEGGAVIWQLRKDGPPASTPELEALASARVGEGEEPDLWFVSRDGVILAVVYDEGGEPEGDEPADEHGGTVPPAVWAVTEALRADMIESRSVGVVWEHPAKLEAQRRAEEAEEAEERQDVQERHGGEVDTEATEADAG